MKAPPLEAGEIAARLRSLSHDERRVVWGLAAGYKKKEIAQDRGCGASTVSRMVKRIRGVLAAQE